MDAKLDIINIKLEKIKEKYPNIMEMWKIYIDTKTLSLNNAINECEIVLNQFENNIDEDIPKKLIYLMYLLTNLKI
tara:strand:+ start:171 stop:398 length:228 start_codon:yes stop_codon:yes gene_type:complete